LEQGKSEAQNAAQQNAQKAPGPSSQAERISMPFGVASDPSLFSPATKQTRSPDHKRINSSSRQMISGSPA